MASDLYDGTQPPPPPTVFPDPLAGLVTGQSADSGAAFDTFSDTIRVEIADPVFDVDHEAIKAMVDASMAEEGDEGVVPAGSTGPIPVQPGPGGQYPHGSPHRQVPALPGMLPPQQRQRPAARQLMRQALNSYPRRRGNPQLAQAPRPPKTSGTAGIVLAIVLMIVFLLIAVQVIEGLVGAFTN